jgi:hypothetical protein
MLMKCTGGPNDPVSDPPLTVSRQPSLGKLPSPQPTGLLVRPVRYVKVYAKVQVIAAGQNQILAVVTEIVSRTLHIPYVHNHFGNLIIIMQKEDIF